MWRVALMSVLLMRKVLCVAFFSNYFGLHFHFERAVPSLILSLDLSTSLLNPVLNEESVEYIISIKKVCMCLCKCFKETVNVA